MQPHCRRRRSLRRGVTLTELVVAVAIVALLAGLTFMLVTVGHRATANVTNQVSAINPKAAPKRRSNVPVPVQPLQYVPNQYLVAFNKGVTDPQAEAARLAQAVPATVLHVYTHAFKGVALRIAPGQLPRLQSDPSVALVGQDMLASPTNVMPTDVSRVRFTNAPATPKFSLFMPKLPRYAPANGGGNRFGNLPVPPLPGNTIAPTIKAVAVIDTGIDDTHPDLFVVYHTGFGTGIPTQGDDEGHGTHVGGIIGARGKKVIGMFPGVPLWSLRVFPPPPAVGAQFADIIAAMDFVTKNASQVSVCNMSLGAGPNVPAAQMTLINTAVSNMVNAGVVCVVAAGNSAMDATTFTPASAPDAICVAALCDTDGLPGGFGNPGSFGDPDDTMTSFSNFGKPVAVMAPGEDILSTFPVAQGSYATLSGTSMASPNCAGMCALLLSNTAENVITSPPGQGFFGNQPRSGGRTSNTRYALVTTPAQVRAWLLTESVEQIPGLAANKDSLSYHVITGRP